MPRYEYKCKSCEKSFEVIHRFDEAIDSCKFCGGKVRRVFHPVGIIFKGSGFYVTDSRNNNGGRSGLESESKVDLSDNGKEESSRKKAEDSIKN